MFLTIKAVNNDLEIKETKFADNLFITFETL